MEQFCCQIQSSPFCASFRTLLHRVCRAWDGPQQHDGRNTGTGSWKPWSRAQIGPFKETLRPESLARLSAPIDPPRPPPASFVHAKDRVCHSHEATCSPASRDPRPSPRTSPQSCSPVPPPGVLELSNPPAIGLICPFIHQAPPSQDSRAPSSCSPAVHASSNSDTSRPAIEIRSTCRHLSADELHSGGPQHTPSLVQLSRLFALTGSVSWPPSARHSNPAAGRLSNATKEEQQFQAYTPGTALFFGNAAAGPSFPFKSSPSTYRLRVGSQAHLITVGSTFILIIASSR